MKIYNRFNIVIVAALLIAGSLCSCDWWNQNVNTGFGSSVPLDAWIAGEMVNVSARTEKANDPEVFDPNTRQVKMFSAANETVSFQVVVDAGLADISGLSIRCADLVSAQGEVIKNENVSVFRAHAVRITKYPPWYLRLVDTEPAATDFYDALVNLDHGGEFTNVKASSRGVLWVDLRVPRDAKEGTYSGKIEVQSRTHKTWSLGVNLDVYNFVLPDARPLITLGGFDNKSLYNAFVKRDGKPFSPVRMDRKDPQIREGLVVMRQLMRLAHQHRIDLFDKGIGPVMQRDMFGKVDLNWEDYDAIVKPYLDGTAFDDRVGCPAWPMPINANWPLAQYYGGPDSELYAKTIGDVAREAQKHLPSSTKIGRKMFYWPYRGDVGPSGYMEHSRLSRIIRAVDRNTPILSELPTNPPSLTGWKAPADFSSLADIRAVRAEYFDPDNAVQIKDASHPLVGWWLAPGAVPYLPSLGVIATPADVRAIPWFAMKYNCSGMFLPEVLHWTGDPYAEPAGAQTRLFYPGSRLGVNEVIPSIRLKRLRRGLQDIAYISLMKQHNRSQAAQSIVNAMTRYAGLQAVGDNYLDPRLDGWVQNPDTWRMARKLLAEEINSAVRDQFGG